LNSFKLTVNTVLHHTPVLVLGNGIAGGQYCWVSGGLLGIILTLLVDIG